MRNVAIIPARGGSKGIKSKNIIDVNGKPLISWSIRQALAAESIESVWVTSDDKTILEVAKKYGANTIKRPDSLSGDTATSESAWVHAIEYIENETSTPIDLVIGIQATSPIREPSDFDNAIRLMFEKGYDSLFSSCEVQDMFIWEEKDGSFTGVNHDYNNRKRRQAITPQYVENGSFYLFSPEKVKLLNNRLYGKIGTYVMDNWKKFQIDTPDDLELCNALMKGLNLE